MGSWTSFVEAELEQCILDFILIQCKEENLMGIGSICTVGMGVVLAATQVVTFGPLRHAPTSRGCRLETCFRLVKKRREYSAYHWFLGATASRAK